ncbi:unnamed protein product [Cyprideis torosa]|uniref:Uncharacterized protein n=1 Tax=Cyprideis torosa TaxID=163714 RepID=A0A7R8WGV4_9CRUS|nr:unnamed protein product [Cyprideis torosa]CAG0892512.1 unnamed protein product [Cyprideis torosa]
MYIISPTLHKVYTNKFYHRCAVDHSLGFGEAYMEGWWDCDDHVEMVFRLAKSGPYRPPSVKLRDTLEYMVNRQTLPRSKEVIKKHYDLGNDLYENFLDSTMNYTCAYWKDAANLEQAQLHKMDLIARKLKLKPGMHVLDLGCGFGSMAKYLAENYNVSVVAYNISEEQVNYARKSCSHLPVEVVLDDYRNAKGIYDRVYSVGLLEHVGRHNYRTYFEVVNRCLKEDGIHLLHAITVVHKDVPNKDRWSDTYIFPNGELPFAKDYSTYSAGLFIIEDLHNFGYDYYKTLMAWNRNFDKNWSKISQNPKYDQRFYRMWKNYLQGAAAFFKSRRFNLCQVVFSKDGLPEGYDSER